MNTKIDVSPNSQLEYEVYIITQPTMPRRSTALPSLIVGSLLIESWAWLGPSLSGKPSRMSLPATVVVDDSEARSAFGTKDYWDETYAGRGDFPADEYSWYYGWEILGKYVKQYVPNQDGKLLLPGIGNDPMLLDLMGHGFKHLTAQDYSQHAIDRQHDLLQYQLDVPDTVELSQGDVCALPESWQGRFDAIIEKGMLDAVYLSGDGNAESAVESLGNTLRPGGIFMSVSGVVPAGLRRTLFPDESWEWLRDGAQELQVALFFGRFERVGF